MHSRSPRWRRKAAAATAVAALSLSLLTACGNDGSSSAGNKLDVWVWQDASDKVQQATVDDFNKTSDVKAKLTAVPGEGYQNKVRTSMGSENAPDVFFNWGGGSVQEYVDKGLLLDLTPYLNKDSEFKNAFLPSVLDAGKVGDKYYGVPMRGSSRRSTPHHPATRQPSRMTTSSRISIGFELVVPAKRKEKFISRAKKAAKPISPPNRNPSPISTSPQATRSANQLNQPLSSMNWMKER